MIDFLSPVANYPTIQRGIQYCMDLFSNTGYVSPVIIIFLCFWISYRHMDVTYSSHNLSISKLLYNSSFVCVQSVLYVLNNHTSSAAIESRKSNSLLIIHIYHQSVILPNSWLVFNRKIQLRWQNIEYLTISANCCRRKLQYMWIFNHIILCTLRTTGQISLSQNYSKTRSTFFSYGTFLFAITHRSKVLISTIKQRQSKSHNNFLHLICCWLHYPLYQSNP